MNPAQMDLGLNSLLRRLLNHIFFHEKEQTAFIGYGALKSLSYKNSRSLTFFSKSCPCLGMEPRKNCSHISGQVWLCKQYLYIPNINEIVQNLFTI